MNLPRITKAGLSMLTHRKYSTSYPLFLKIDLSPLCNIHCATCIHANIPKELLKKENAHELLSLQQFNSSQRMPLDHYRKIIDEVKGKTLSVVLHYLGDPYMFPDLDEASLIAYKAGMRVHVGSNFSYKFSDERINSIINSGVTDLTVCVDGLTQELYERTRVGGKIDLVLNNLERLCQRRRELQSKRPHIEVQYIRFDHNKHEETAIKEKVLAIGVDQFSTLNGYTINYVNRDPCSGIYKVRDPLQPKRFGFPNCHWPYTSMVIRYDGEVIPCCYYRLGSQYANGIKPITLGNVFDSGVKTIWNSKAYQELRKQIFDGSIMPDNSFCYGCDRLFQFECENRYFVDPQNGGLTINLP
jgi:MoaA/NifB/PqqE/SkfB family radical SAM enzyme